MTPERAQQILNANRSPETPAYTLEEAREALQAAETLARLACDVVRSLSPEEIRRQLRAGDQASPSSPARSSISGSGSARPQ